jgi:hypothetical protein
MLVRSFVRPSLIKALLLLLNMVENKRACLRVDK